MDNIRFIKPTDLHAEMLRLHQEQQMDFLECLTGMDWGETTDKDTPAESYLLHSLRDRIS